MGWQDTQLLQSIIETVGRKIEGTQERVSKENMLEKSIHAEGIEKELDREADRVQDSSKMAHQEKLAAQQIAKIIKLQEIENEKRRHDDSTARAYDLKVWDKKQEDNMAQLTARLDHAIDELVVRDSLERERQKWATEKERLKSAESYVAPTDLLRGSLAGYLGEEGGLLGLGWNESDMYDTYYGQQDILSGQSPRDLMQSIHGDLKKMKMLGDEDNEQVESFKKLVSDLYFKAAGRDYGKDFMDDWKGDTNVKGQAIFYELEKLMDELGINKTRSGNMPRANKLSKVFDWIGGTERSDWGGY